MPKNFPGTVWVNPRYPHHCPLPLPGRALTHLPSLNQPLEHDKTPVKFEGKVKYGLIGTPSVSKQKLHLDIICVTQQKVSLVKFL
jgi:hypothetical protein